MTERISITENGNEAHVDLRGQLDETCAVELYELVGSWLEQVDRPRITIDLDGIVKSTLLARAKLIELQRLIQKANGRTAWVSRRPRFRGMALVVCHAAGDSGAKVLATAAQAPEWLAGDGRRMEDAIAPVERSMARVHARRKGQA